jgi:selenide,water dikinase
MDVPIGIRHHLVLVGGGHSHVEVLRDWAREPVPAARLAVLVDRPTAVYSGMVPGFVAGQYRLGEIEIDVWPPASGAAWVGARATPDTRGGGSTSRSGVSYDTVSFDVARPCRASTIPASGHAPDSAHRRLRAFGGHALERARDARFRLVVVGRGRAASSSLRVQRVSCARDCGEHRSCFSKRARASWPATRIRRRAASIAMRVPAGS